MRSTGSRRATVQPLDARRMLAASIDAGGLPREMTQVGDFVYYAQDARADGKLSYTNLIRLDPSTGERIAIVRSDGKRFGAQPYELKTLGDRLLIGVDTSTTTSYHQYEFDSVRPGDTRATRLIGALQYGFPPQSTRVGGTTYFVADDERGATAIFALSRRDAAAHIAIDPQKLFAGGGIASLASWHDHLAIGMTAGPKGSRVYVSDGTQAGTHQRSVPVPKGFTLASLWPVGDAMAVDVQDTIAAKHRVFVFDDFDDDAAHAYSSEPKSAFVQVLGSDGEHALMRTTTTDNKPHTVFTAFTSRSTIALPSPIGGFSTVRLFRDGDALYVSKGTVQTAADPEAAGGYAAPTTDRGSYFTTGQVSLTIDTSFSYYEGDIALWRFDLKSRTVQTLRGGSSTSSDPIYRSFAADSFMRANGRVYFRGGQAFDSDGSSKPDFGLWQTDGTPAGTFLVAPMFGLPFAVDGTVGFVDSASSSRIQRDASPRFGSLEAYIVDDKAHASTLTAEMAGPKVSFPSVYLDLDHDAKQDGNEPTAIVDQRAASAGRARYLLPNLKPGKYDLRIVQPKGQWTATRGWSKAVTVKAGTTRQAIFGLADDVGVTIRGIAYGVRLTNFAHHPIPNHTAYVDLNNNRQHDAGEPTSVTDANGNFRFDHLQAGRYTISLIEDVELHPPGLRQLDAFEPGKTYVTSIDTDVP